MRVKRALGRLGLLVAGLALALVAAEAVVRLVAPHTRDHVLPGGMFVMDDVVGWRLAANRTARHQTRYFDVEYRTNDLGFRDPSRRVAPAEGPRFLVFGDSQVFGWGVEAGNRFTDLLEASAPGLEVWNLAVPGYGLDQQIVSYSAMATTVPIDGVIFYVSRAGLRRSTRSKIYRKFKPRFELASGGLSEVPVPVGMNRRYQLLYRALSPFYLPHLVEQSLMAISRDQGSRRGAASGSLTELDAALIRHGIELARSHGHEARILNALKAARAHELERLCSESGVAEVRLDIVGLGDAAAFGPHDPHWTAATHAAIARQIEAAWENRGWSAER